MPPFKFLNTPLIVANIKMDQIYVKETQDKAEICYTEAMTVYVCMYVCMYEYFPAVAATFCQSL